MCHNSWRLAYHLTEWSWAFAPGDFARLVRANHESNINGHQQTSISQEKIHVFQPFQRTISCYVSLFTMEFAGERPRRRRTTGRRPCPKSWFHRYQAWQMVNALLVYCSRVVGDWRVSWWHGSMEPIDLINYGPVSWTKRNRLEITSLHRYR